MKFLPLSWRLAPAALAAAIMVLAAPVPLAAQIRELAPAPASPAFYTQSPSCVREVAGDSFLFVCDGGREVRVRLFDADCSALDEAARAQAKAVAARLLEEDLFWVFPVGQTKAGAVVEVWADVWTSKGWLSQVLLRAGYARPQSGPANQALSPFDAAGTSNKGPPPPSPAIFTTAKSVSGDTFEVQDGGKKFPIRLFDARLEGLEAAKANEASATAARLLGSDGAWIFPCGPQPTDGKTSWPVRIWTREGWLSDVLVKAGQAVRGGPAEKALAAKADKKPDAARKSAGEDKPAPEKKAKAEKKPAEAVVSWVPLPVKMAAMPAGQNPMVRKYSRGYAGNGTGDSNDMDCEPFKIASGVWRISWEAKAADKYTRVGVQVSKCQSADAPNKKSAQQVASFSSATGVQVLTTGPGAYWIKISGVSEATVKVEAMVRTTAAPPPPAP